MGPGDSGGRLNQLSFGRDDAEADVRADKGGLLRAGFVRSAAFEAVLAGRKHVVIGRMGSGKTAICRELAAGGGGKFQVSLVTPGGVSPGDFSAADLQGFAAGLSAQLLWRYVLGVQVAKYAVARAAKMRGRQVPRSVEVLQKFLADNQEEADLRVHRPLSAYAGRLRSVSLGAFGATVGVQLGEPPDARRPSGQVEVIDRAVLAALEDLGRPAGHSRLLLLVDELEQLWSGDAWSCALVSGLLLAARHVTSTFPAVDCAVFVRADVYDALRFPQKDRLRGEELRIGWTAEGMGMLALARARASVGQYLEPADLWGRLFPAAIDGRPAADYLISRTLSRPRDFIQLAGKCREIAVGRGHPAVSAADVREAEAEFSAWKRRDLEAEYAVSYPFLPEILALFQDSTYIISRRRLNDMLSKELPGIRERYPAHVSSLTLPGIVGVLYETGFLGVRREQHISYSHRGAARPYTDERSFYIHPCFRLALGAVRATSVHESETWRISLWGPTASGKSTYLAALNTAAAQSLDRPLIYGRNNDSTDFLARSTHSLNRQRFPSPSIASQPLRFAINVPALGASNHATTIPAVPTQFNIDIQDDPGLLFNPEPDFRPGRLDIGGMDNADEETAFVGGLSRSDGFIFLIDPDLGPHGMYDGFGALLLKIAQRCNEQKRIGDGWLPHYLAACIAKFDRPDIYQWAESSGNCQVRPDDPHRFPHVPDDMAKDFFTSICSKTGVRTIPAIIDQYFHPDRIRYFVISSIGFHLDSATAQFDEHDYQNLMHKPDGEPRIRSGIHPIGVIEPILWLGRCLTTVGD